MANWKTGLEFDRKLTRNPARNRPGNGREWAQQRPAGQIGETGTDGWSDQRKVNRSAGGVDVQDLLGQRLSRGSQRWRVWDSRRPSKHNLQGQPLGFFSSDWLCGFVAHFALSINFCQATASMTLSFVPSAVARRAASGPAPSSPIRSFSNETVRVQVIGPVLRRPSSTAGPPPPGGCLTLVLERAYLFHDFGDQQYKCGP